MPRAGERIGDDEARVVSGRFVLRTRIAKGDDGVQGLALWRFVLVLVLGLPNEFWLGALFFNFLGNFRLFLFDPWRHDATHGAPLIR